MTSDKPQKQAISKITIWRKADQRAPQKPLLLLYVLSLYRQGQGILLSYCSEINEPLLDLLQRYGPQSRAQRPNMPFWR
ncbi:HNH endonuclease, partial [Escherichia coli]|nr:HNH endonuclease [Escherichia coli]